MVDVSIILVNYNGLGLTLSCIGSIIFSEHGLGYEIIVVDNGSSDGSVEALSSDGRIKFVPLGCNAGFGAANNEGLKLATGRNVLFLNNDTIVHDGAISALSSFLDSHPEAGACGGNLFAPGPDGGYGEPSVSMSPSFPSFIEELRGFFDLQPASFNDTGSDRKVAVISGADLMVRRSVLDQTGGFNPEFFMYYEDTELCWRVHKAGFGIWSVPAARIIHIGGASSGPSSDDPHRIARLRLKYESRRKFYLLCRGRVHLALSDLIWRLKVDSRILIHVFNPGLRDKWLAYRRNLV